MNFNELVTKHNMRIKRVLHVGGHLGEEANDYRHNGVRHVTWVEADPIVARDLERAVRRFHHRVINALVTDQDNVEMEFYVTNEQSLSSSVLHFGTHAKTSPDMVVEETKVLTSRTINSLMAEGSQRDWREIDLLNMDVQGAELMVLRGATDLLPQLRYVLSEVNHQDVYQSCAQIEQLDALLLPYGLVRMDTYFTMDGWGDALWVKRKELASDQGASDGLQLP